MNINQKNQMSLGVVLSYLSIVVNLVAGILYTPILLHSLGQSQYGVYSLCASFIGYLTILNAGVNAAYIRFYVQEKTKKKDGVPKLNGLFCKIFIVLSCVGFIGGLLISLFSPVLFGSKITPEEYDLVRKCFVLFAFTIGIEIFTCFFKSFIIANEKFIFAKITGIIASVLYPVMAIPLLLRGYDCTAIISVRLIVDLFTIISDFIFCRRKLKMKFYFTRAERDLLKDISQFIGFIALQSVMDQLNWQIDKFILARTHGTTEVSLYSVGATFNYYFLLIGSAVSGVFIAEINRIVANKDNQRLNGLFRRTSKLFTYIVGFIIIAYFIFGNQFICRWAGPDYNKSYTIGWLLMSPVTFALIMGLGQDIARAKNKHQLQIVINLGVCIVNAIVSIPLAIHLGAVGSALGTFVAEIIVCIIVQPIYYNKVLLVEVKGVLVDIIRYFPGIVLPILFGFSINRLGLLRANYISIFVYGILFTIIYAVNVVFFSMNDKDRKYVFGLLKNRKH